jgi:hypothetical protein
MSLKKFYQKIFLKILKKFGIKYYVYYLLLSLALKIFNIYIKLLRDMIN